MAEDYNRQKTIVLGMPEAPTAPSQPRSPKGPLIAVVVVIVVVAALAIFANRPTTAPTAAELEQEEQVRDRSDLSGFEQAEPELREPAARPERRPPGLPLNQLVPGFVDLLIVSHTNEGGDPFYQVLWGPGANTAARTAAFDDGVFDLSGNYFARFENSQWNGVMLAIGDLSSESSGPVSVGSDAFAWHDTEPGLIAYTTELEVGRRALFTGEIVRRPGASDLLVEYVQDIGGAQLVGWGDFGFALESDGELIMIGTNGADLGRAPVQYLGRDTDGALLVAQAGAVSRTQPDLAELSEPVWLSQVAGVVTRSVLSPYRPMIALEVQEPSGLAIYVATDTDLVRLELGDVTIHGWGSQGDYLIMSRDEGRKSVLMFYGVDSDEVFELEMTDRVDGVFTRRP